jgi:hypothetical protein
VDVQYNVNCHGGPGEHQVLRLTWDRTLMCTTTIKCCDLKFPRVTLFGLPWGYDAAVVSLGGVPQGQKMLKGHLPRVMYDQVC